MMLRRGAHKFASVLECGAHMHALKLKREAMQACILMLKHDPEVRVDCPKITEDKSSESIVQTPDARQHSH